MKLTELYRLPFWNGDKKGWRLEQRESLMIRSRYRSRSKIFKWEQRTKKKYIPSVKPIAANETSRVNCWFAPR